MSEEDQALGKAPVAIISYNLWQNSFNGDSHVVGKPIKLNGHVYDIIGVAPQSFIGLDLSYRPDIYVLVSIIGDIVPGSGAQPLQTRRSRGFVIRARLRPGLKRFRSPGRSHCYLFQPYSRISYGQQRHKFHRPERFGLPAGKQWSRTLAVLLGLVVFVLLIACANVGSMLMARATGRLAATTIQLALGASRKRLFRQMMTESIVFVILGGAFGLILTWVGIRLAVFWFRIKLPPWAHFSSRITEL